MKTIRDLISIKLLKNLKSKSFHVSDKIIETTLREALSSKGINLERLKCSEGGVSLLLSGKKLGVELEYDIIIHIDNLLLTHSRHEAVFSILDDDLRGSKFIGTIVASLLGLIVNDIVAIAISKSNLEKAVEYDKNQRKAIVDLQTITGIQKLYRKRFVLAGKRMIDLINIIGVSHESDGVKIHFSFDSSVS